MPDKLPSRANAARRKLASTKVPVDAATPHPDLGLALAGGDPLGVTYEIGALNALAESLDGIDFTGLGVYVGVSTGSVLAAGLANGIRLRLDVLRDSTRMLVPGAPARMRPAPPVVRDLEAAIVSLEAWLRPHSARSAH